MPWGLLPLLSLENVGRNYLIMMYILKQTEETIRSLAAIANDNENLEFPYFSSKNSDSKLYIVITSDTGLCGGYNNNIVSYLSSLAEDDKDKMKVMTIGAKGIPT